MFISHITPCSRALLVKLMVLHPVMKFPAFCDSHLPLLLSDVPTIFPYDQDQSSPHPLKKFFNIHFNIILPCTAISGLTNLCHVPKMAHGIHCYPILYFFCLTSISILWRIFIYTHIRDWVVTVYELPLLPNNTAVNFVISVHPPAWNNPTPTEQILVKFYIWGFSKNLSRKFKFH